MEFIDKPERPLQVPSEATQHVIDAYSSVVIKSIFTKIQKYIEKLQSSSNLTQQEAKNELHFDKHELLFIEKCCSPTSNDIQIETPKECIIGNGEKQLKVKLDVLHKMKERKLMTEVVNSSRDETPAPPPGGSGCAPEIRNSVIPNKNAYEIRLDVLKESIPFSKGDPDRAIKIADLFYKFVENRKRL